MRSAARHTAAVLAALLVISCKTGQESSSTTEPTPTVAQVAGAWRGTLQFTSVSGGDCVGTHFQTLVGSPQTLTATLQQTGNAVTATIRDPHGLTCQFSGNASFNTVFLEMNSCDPSIIAGFRCPSNGQLRDLRLISVWYQATADSPNVATGLAQETWSVWVTGSQLGLETMTVRGTFTMTRQ